MKQEGQQKIISNQTQDILAVFAAYSGAAYTVTDEWNCQYACEYPGTQGTIIEHHWNIGFPQSVGYIARNPSGRIIVVAFQGTDDISQWIDNLNITQVPWPPQISGSQVHAGFLRGYTSAQDSILSKLESLANQYPGYSIAIVGHSLGGARAAICLLDISIKMPDLLPRISLFTQGQPRTGNKEFANAVDNLQSSKYRVVYEYDIATRLPLFSMDYHHHATEAWIHHNQTLLCLTQTIEDGCSGNGDILHPLKINDHYNYPGLKHE
ncbi:alpha/beta-hydrolase [Coemansia reversa NRRL 1564]|uniref:Alpha/beta-hydrolase n=1 Tax=Coemansia reversa (strain ATCC 12441 / NRRL 1564) TaxID=763665 RepID=A0A2G5BJQ8_COERN|nr:alpha/beta-hydrolase [Coemansia reversa NRRL 1564]|eukprot:PIA19248.1 alpha/beta-hydrolase [Coemansia reversa NRRL 1564]